MRRLVLIHQHDPFINHVGGVGTFINTFFKYSPKDFEVQLVGVTESPTERPVGKWTHFERGGRRFDFLPIVNAHPTYHGKTPLSLKFVWALKKYRKMINFEDAIIEMHRIEPELALRNLPNKKVVFYHTHPIDLYNPKTEVFWRKFPPAYFMLEKWLLKNMDHAYAVREDILTWHREKYPEFKKKPFMFLPTWADTDIFKIYSEDEKQNTRAQLLKEQGLDSDSKILLYVGRYELQKDPMLLMESFKHLNQKMPKAKLILIGGGSLEGEIRNYIEKHQLQKEALMIGPQPQGELAKWMAASDCFVLTSAYEGMPRVVVECLNCGLAAVGYDDKGAINRLINKPETGRLVTERTPEAFSQAFEAVLNQTPNPQACFESAEPYSARAILKQLFDSYRELTGENNEFWRK